MGRCSEQHALSAKVYRIFTVRHHQRREKIVAARTANERPLTVDARRTCSSQGYLCMRERAGSGQK